VFYFCCVNHRGINDPLKAAQNQVLRAVFFTAHFGLLLRGVSSVFAVFFLFLMPGVIFLLLNLSLNEFLFSACTAPVDLAI